MDPQEKRQQLLNAVPAWYNPWLHLAATNGICIAAFLTGLLNLSELKAWELLAVPAILLLSNAVEWRAHKDLLHRKWFKPFDMLYFRHTPQHHMAFPYEQMSIQTLRELQLVLLPSFGILAIILLVAPLAFLAGQLISANVGWLVLMSSGIYVLAYELTHLSYHLPPESWIGRSRTISFLREHHRRHHHPKLMQDWNFNVTFPLYDWARGTIVSRQELEKAISQP